MKPRREINIFSISFIDVFCCALGAMILIFVLNNQALTDNVQSALEEYRKERTKAEEQTAKAKEAREVARIARNDAQKSRDLALKARNQAQTAERKAVQRLNEAIDSKREALQQKEAAMDAAKATNEAQRKARLALEQMRRAKERLEKAKRVLEKRNDQLAEERAEMQKLLEEKEIGDTELQALLTKLKALEDEKKETELARTSADNKVDDLLLELEKLRSAQEALTKENEEEKEKAKALAEDLDDLRNQKSDLDSRLRSRLAELREKEAQIRKKEARIRKREKELKEKDEEIAGLQEESLFGISVEYDRILFLIDRSGSIIQNDWKKVLTGTCNEILEHCDVNEFAIIAFSSNMRFYPTRRGSTVGGNQQSKKEAVEWLSKDVVFGGSTHLHEALRIAYEEYGTLDAIFLLTDGLPSARNRTTKSLEREITKYIKRQVDSGVDTKIITIAIGYPPSNSGQYADIYRYLHKISDMTGGQYLGR